MENDQKKKLDLVFETDFQKLNVLLSNNGFPSCDAFGKKSFKSSLEHITLDEENIAEDKSLVEYEDPHLSIVTSQTLIENEYFIPTRSPIEALKTKLKTNVKQNREVYKTYSKILI